MYKTKINRYQQVCTAAQWKQLRSNYDENLKRRGNTVDFVPVVKLFNPRGAATWLLTECDEDGIAFGLCDLGFGSPELGYVSLEELCGVGFIERDLYFRPRKTLSEYSYEAREKGGIVA